jgi:hypothetical protein
MTSPAPRRLARKGARLPTSSLGTLEKVGSGGQATVYRPARFPGLLYKKYLAPARVNADALDRLRRVRLAMAKHDREYLDGSAAWPAILVEEAGRTVGFLMAPAGDHFFHQFGSNVRKPTDLQYLIFKPKPAWNSLILPGVFQRLEICRLIATAVDTMHRNKLVIGDISMSNILWAVRPEPAVYLIDCDGVRQAGGLPVLEQATTPDWSDPKDPSRATFDTDMYKLALAVLRVLASDPYLAPGQGIPSIPWLATTAQTKLRRVSDQVGSGHRYSASHWLDLLEGIKTSMNVATALGAATAAR